MSDTQGEIRVANDPDTRSEGSSSPEQTVASTVARMLANPRRVRRD